MAEKTLQPFTDVPFADLPQSDAYTIGGGQFFPNAEQIQIGFGSNVFRADQQGIWLGSSAFAQAEASSFAVSMNGTLYATGAVISGTITATAGVIGGFTIGATTLTGNGSGGDILTASSGERIEMRSSTKRINFINASNHTTLSMHTGGTYTSALIAIAPQDDDRGCITITTISGNTKPVIDVASQGTGQTMNVRQTSSSNTNVAFYLENAGSAQALYVSSDSGSSPNHTAHLAGRPSLSSVTNASVLYIDLSSSAFGNGIYINDPTSNATSYPLRINRAGNNGSDIYAVKVGVTNSGGRAIGIDLTGAAYAFSFNSDTTAAGAYVGRIPINVGGTTRYLHYFAA